MHGIAKISTKIRPHAYIISYKKTKKNTEKWLKYLLNAYSLEFFFSQTKFYILNTLYLY